MKKRAIKKIAALMMGCSVITGCLSLTSCVEEVEEPDVEIPDVHTHSWKEEWAKDSTNHWHECSGDDCDLIYKAEAHTFENGVCSVCGQTEQQEETDTPSKDEVTILGITAYDHMQSSRRETQLLQKVFKVGDEFNTINLALRVTKRANRVETTENLPLSNVEISTPDMTTAGEKTVTIKYGEVETSYTITVLDFTGVDKEKATVTVNKDATAGVNGNVVTVKSINDAVRVFKLLGTDANTTKTINVAEGVYHEKVEFDIPNIHIIGASTDASKTMIEYDLMAAYITPGGTAEYSTDGSASVSIREGAIGFHAENISFQNYWNTNSRYEESRIIANNGLSGNTQAVACLVQADKCIFDNVRFSGYHDTLYSQKGRHIYNKCYIEGRTDYIFGDSATSYFNECTISTIGANSATNGGYIIATRGCKSSAADSVEYGYIFNKCTLTADSYVKDGTVSLARGWADWMTLAFIECNISSAYSKTAYGTKTDNKNDRYTSMAAEPHAELLFEYNNTGAGALDVTTPGLIDKLCTIISEERAQEYLDYSKIFAKKNGNFEYSTAWDGTAGANVPITYQFVDYEAQSSVNTNGENHELFGGAILINGQYRLCGASNGCVQLTAGTVITVTKPGAVSLDWYGSGYGSPANGIISYKNGYATIKIVDAAGTTGIYVKSITVDNTQPAIHEHVYTDWTFTTLPTADTEGLATRTCTDCELETPYVQEIVLPVLSEENYQLAVSENAGKTIYTYVCEAGNITFEADSLAGVHVHAYGDWTVEEANIPTFEATGKMTRTCTDEECNNDDSKTESKDLPVLSDEAYVITNNTATITEKGTGTYTITVDGVTVSFTAETATLPNIQTYSFTTIEAGNYTGTVDAPYEVYNGDISMVGTFRFSSVGTQFNKGTVITMKVAGTVTIDWFGGDYGTEADGEIIYKDGCATITIIGSGVKGAYIKNIIVDREDIPDDSQTFTVNLLGDNDANYGSISIIEGKKLSLDQIEAAIPAVYDVEKVYTSSEKTTEFDFTVSISGNTDLYVTVVETTNPITFSFADYAQNAKPESFFDGYITVNSSNYWLNGSAVRVAVGDTIVSNIKGEITITWFGGSYGTEANGSINYKNGYGVLTILDDTASTGGIYIKSITIDPTKDCEHTHTYQDEWTYEVPTLEATGKAYKTCTDCELETPHVLEVVLPALTDTNYTVKDNTATVGVKGTGTYTITIDDVTFTFTGETDALPEGTHIHTYAEEWTITAPTSTDAGTAVKKCTTENCGVAGDTITLELPVLTDSAYTITNNTATTEAAGTGTYTITIGDYTVSFTAETPVVELSLIETSFSYSYSSQGNNSSEFIELVNCQDNSPYLKLVSGSVVKVRVAEGAIVSVTGIYTGWGQFAINGVNQDSATTVSYTATEAGYVTITLASIDGQTQAALQGVNVKYPVKEIASDYTYTFTQGDLSAGASVPSTDYVEFEGCTVHNSVYLLLYPTSYVKINVKAGAVVTIKGYINSADGGWASFLINDVAQAYESGAVTYTATEDGELIIKTAGNYSSISSISVVYSA